MKFASSLLSAILLASFSLAQNPAGAASPNIQIARGTLIRAELTKAIDAKKAKVGDDVMARITDGFRSTSDGVPIPKGSKLLAHVAAVSPRQKDSPSAIGITLDKIVLKDGTEIPLKGGILAIGAAGNPNLTTGGEVKGGVLTTASPGTMGNGAKAPVFGNEVQSSEPSNEELKAKTAGMVPIPGLDLNPGHGDVSTVSSEKHDVKLDSGTQILIRVVP